MKICPWFFVLTDEYPDGKPVTRCVEAFSRDKEYYAVILSLFI